LGFIPTEGADFTGDGRDELVFFTFNNATGAGITFYIGDANTGAGISTLQYGNFNTDSVITPADYTGDNIADIVVARTSDSPITWYIRNTARVRQLRQVLASAHPVAATMTVRCAAIMMVTARHDIAVWRRVIKPFTT
jgi:hypothetical protein